MSHQIHGEACIHCHHPSCDGCLAPDLYQAAAELAQRVRHQEELAITTNRLDKVCRAYRLHPRYRRLYL